MSMKEKIPVIAIVGPTASGKTGLAVGVEERLVPQIQCKYIPSLK